MIIFKPAKHLFRTIKKRIRRVKLTSLVKLFSSKRVRIIIFVALLGSSLLCGSQPANAYVGSDFTKGNRTYGVNTGEALLWTHVVMYHVIAYFLEVGLS